LRWRDLHKANGAPSLLPALGAAVLIASVVVWFVSNNNSIFLRQHVHKHTRAIPQPIPRMLALADSVADVPSDYLGRIGWLPRIPNSISKRAFNHAERSQLLRVYLRLGEIESRPVSWCPVPGKPCNDLVFVEYGDEQILLDPARGGALKQRGAFVRPGDLKGSWSFWPSEVPELVSALRRSGFIDAWPGAVDRIDQLLAQLLTGAFLVIIVLLRLQRRQRNQAKKQGSGQGDDQRLNGALETSKVESEQRRHDEDELQRALDDHHGDAAGATIEEPVGDVVPAPSERVETQAQPGHDQLTHLDKRQRDQGDRD